MTGHRPRKYDSEEVTHERVVQFLRREYPGIIHRTDFAAGIKLPEWLAKRQKRVQIRRGFPDIFIFEPVFKADEYRNEMFHGLALELKKHDVKLKLNDGRWASDHVKEQYAMLKILDYKGYAAAFARGYDEAVAVIKWYLDRSEDIEFDDFIPRITLGDVTDIEEAF